MLVWQCCRGSSRKWVSGMLNLLHSMLISQQGKELTFQCCVQLKNKDAIMQQYGSAAEKAPEDGLLLGQTERYVEYDATGRVIKGQDIKAHSRYEEDVHPNNHTSVWGSWWEAGAWGYACCHQTFKNSYCTGEAGIAGAEAQADQMQLNIDRKVQEDQAREANGNTLKVCCSMHASMVCPIPARQCYYVVPKEIVVRHRM